MEYLRVKSLRDFIICAVIDVGGPNKLIQFKIRYCQLHVVNSHACAEPQDKNIQMSNSSH